VYFYKNFYDTKNRDFISDKVHSIQLEIQNKILDYDSLSINNQAFISEYLTKFANVFFADIHIYSIRGELFTTSRPELFDLGFMSGLISPTAYMKICYQSESVFVVKENIGAMQYYSAYVPLVNHNNKLIGIVNVPFFAKHNEFEKDVSKYLATFLNVFLFLAILAILLAFVITNQFVRPLRIISAYFADLKIGQANTRIAFNRKDEIGRLIMLYNSMVDQLEDAVVRLREKERESAWKDVARQVAHEIKNPLTPIKLGLQFLIHARRRNDPDWELKFTSFSESLFQQIESLNQLANSFSEFTQLPESEYRNELLAELINNSAIVLNDFKGTFQIVNNSPERVIYCDKNQISRVLINLFKNAMQAIPEQISGVIQVKVTVQGKEIVIQLTDNGIGISKLDEHKIFSPNFTTKSGGMGIGLFMSKVIIEGHGGRIWFESDSGKGTIFYISLPLSTN
jgi:nitrogen fixation/metabolism regulation signal transduction histidine kinase